MECLYLPDLKESSYNLVLPEDESKHIRSLRLRHLDRIMITNGKGLVANATLDLSEHKHAKANIDELMKNEGEIERDVTLALGILSNKDRFEFALEKSIELGVKSFIPLITQRCQKTTVKTERLNSKAIAALKQCKRAFLPTIEQPITLTEYINTLDNDVQIVQANQFGENVSNFHFDKKVVMVIGPEGGLSPEEFTFLIDSGASKVNFGNRRLRAETAAIVGTAFACK